MKRLIVAVIVLMVACQSAESPAPPASSIGSSSSASPSSSPATSGTVTAAASTAGGVEPGGAANAPGAGRSLPAIDLKCTADKDCAIFDEEISGATACCTGCQWKPANTTSLAAFRAACKSSPPQSCPALGCAMPVVHPKCVSGSCQAAAGAH